MKHFIALLLTAVAITATAQVNTTLGLPLVFDTNRDVATTDTLAVPSLDGNDGVSTDDSWLAAEQRAAERINDARYRASIANPQLVEYNLDELPDAPKPVVVDADPTMGLLTIDAPQVEAPTDVVAPPVEPVKVHNWLHTFEASLHFTQAYVSSNWYQGGENNVNLLGDIKWDFNLNQDVHPNWLFNNTLHYKAGISTAHADTIRDYTINEDNFLFTSQLGYKAVKNWYYSAMLQFKTQFFNNYKSNTRDMKAAFLSPGELNLGLGMTYDYKSAEGDRTFSLAIAPVSYNMKICRDIHKLDPTSFGIKAGHHTKHDIGSNIEAKSMMKFGANIVWTSRLYIFTNYKYVQGDWENTFDFSVTRHLNTKIYTHLRFDKSQPRDKDWKFWQFKEILSFGLTYRFATN